MRWVLHRRSETFQEQSPQARTWQEQQPSVTLGTQLQALVRGCLTPLTQGQCLVQKIRESDTDWVKPLCDSCSRIPDFACVRFAAAGFRPSYKADEEDQKFVEHVNSKIRMQHREADGGDCPAGRDPKALSTPLAQETFERLIETFEILLARTKAHQVRAASRLPSVTTRITEDSFYLSCMCDASRHLVSCCYQSHTQRTSFTRRAGLADLGPACYQDP